MILTIDTSDKQQVVVSIKGGRAVIKLASNNEWGSQVLLALILKALTKQSIDFKDLKAIELNIGPGSYTGLRVGAAVANALGFALQIPVNGKDSAVELIYT
ncbi:tRNA (adenosine(37)-N6)-threonylcarbamoyltransferase complex dimerization subunit type 1 TsaB [Candidatus Daviesbacteria bacterium RIFCSPHIGHO2_01_FULL_44_29]|uniref:tRNA (Adenosine(37)-N6)-threonylcarbamoyltransferase complex dimerization subunit type 1 TsaB n=1 Tax=Candidatus Daviesbacteria bacterium RIFCSPHIGHO2_02_FULL_43_12 TaxID=1797776 RepID=A0A1F5KKL1_9BACT|nr:MAG: tRNA (adenosine(37)-N6)-threonylcarbamoyltransferase complex dimerization subunit type 1 TsaB [Candidatus Daviesbacteria bacterium RIFCSPHIGHO2_01_FULL_44_29]OGE41369.1 MAG: tRNA (adenosine(37)-N6)-threonylcarbamoyltransferase complex dimerization subunit type 1 TsaB [Candidatus Daviesbacteria bacterium RIFCSPHIGHO2_02_FULL_43_12]OGE69570.1 MAG: tRNA (adenosine(37)-N6)-threonylcarbamoyltransferase complex dimerization subunit type 1 TsaB [Candidatus Daviesbacteria bacterium RIFCSPLOWO2_01